MVGNIVMGTRIGGASGREIADIEEDSDMARKVKQTWHVNMFFNIKSRQNMHGK